ncbi:MAG: hypothetical protein JWM68_1847 [Verrucomicrobiales bacterium]|nr:hypothetical protein [Verrucomicrobiales bacterium]
MIGVGARSDLFVSSLRFLQSCLERFLATYIFDRIATGLGTLHQLWLHKTSLRKALSRYELSL